jgi:MFS family permease
MVCEFGWSRTMVTSGNAISKLVVGPLFGFLAGWIVDRSAAAIDARRHSDGGCGARGARRGLGVVDVRGRLLMGWLADRMRRKHVMLIIYTLVALAIPLLVASGSPRSLYVFALVFGLGLGGEYMIIPLMAGELFGVRVLGRVMGIILTVDGVAEATAPMLVGYLRDLNGTYDAGFITLIATAVAGAAAIALLPSRTSSAVGGAPTRAALV